MELIKPQNLSLSSEQLMMLMPYLVISLGALATLVVGVSNTFGKNLLAAAGTGLLTLVVTMYSLYQIWGEPSTTLFNGMLAADYYTNVFNLLFVVATTLVLLSSYSYLEREGLNHMEYYSLLLFACLGMMLLASSLDLVVLFVALEIMSIAVYVLVGFRRADVKSNEAALKYFILGSAASAVLLYGVALTYGATGSLNLQAIGEYLKGHPQSNSMLNLGAVLMVSGFLFKVASVPFHMWMPDVYEGAPTTITNFMTTGLKAAAFAAFIRVFISLGGKAEVLSGLSLGFHNILWIVALLTMFLGNVIALTQKNFKRMLAYSSIAHTGYILVGFIAGGRSEYGYASIVLYLVAYVLMNAGAFTILSMLAGRGDRDLQIEDFAGLGFKKPFLGFAMAVFMFSMAGIPPTVGFAGKYLIFSSAVQAGEIWLAVLAVLCSAISAYYYLRVIVVMYMKEPVRETAPLLPAASFSVVVFATAATLQLGIFPSALIEAAKKAAYHL